MQYQRNKFNDQFSEGKFSANKPRMSGGGTGKKAKRISQPKYESNQNSMVLGMNNIMSKKKQTGRSQKRGTSSNPIAYTKPMQNNARI